MDGHITEFEHGELSYSILQSCFEVINELGPCFLESVYKNALFYELKQKGLNVEAERSLEVFYKDKKVGIYRADIIVENKIIIELKCCRLLLPEHMAQVINYLKATNIPLGLLVSFGNSHLQYKRLTRNSKKQI